MPVPTLPDQPGQPDPLDPKLQKAILLAMREKYPSPLARIPAALATNPAALIANLTYLEGHGLCRSGLKRSADDQYQWSGATITARGLDYLREDGGLTAELGVLIVKIHADTIRQMIEARIESSITNPNEKENAKRLLRSLPETALQAAVSQLVVSSLAHLPNVAAWLHTLSLL